MTDFKKNWLSGEDMASLDLLLGLVLLILDHVDSE